MATTDPTPVYDALSGLLAQRSDLRLAIVFGSWAEGRARPDSDIDLAVAAAERLDAKLKMDLIEAVAERCGSPVDLIDLRTAGEPLLGRILQSGHKVLVRDTRLLGELYKRHLFDSADFLPYRRRILEERRRAWIGS